MKRLLEAHEIQELLGIHQSTFYRLLQRDPTFPVRKIGRHWKADPDELQDWVKNQPTFIQEAEEKQNVVPFQPKRKGRPPLSGTAPREKAVRR